MASIFEDFLLPLDSLSFEKNYRPLVVYSEYPHEYQSLSGLFSLQQSGVEKEKLWYWSFSPLNIGIDYSALPLLNDYANKQKGHTSWEKARDEVIAILETLFPEKEIDPRVTQRKRNVYYLKSQIYPKIRTHTNTYRHEKCWQVRLAMFNSFQILPNNSNTRKESLKTLHDYVSNELFNLYSKTKEISNWFDNKNCENKQLCPYKTDREKILQNFYSQNPNEQIIQLWWTIFIKPEIDLTDIFK